MDSNQKTVIKKKPGRKQIYFTEEEKQEANRIRALNCYYRKKAKQNTVLKETLTNEEKQLLELIKKMKNNNV